MLDKGVWKYLSSTLSVKIEPRQWKAEVNLPAYLNELYKFNEAKILETRCLFLSPRKESQLPPAALSKHIEAIKKKWGGEIIYASRSMDLHNRKRLIAQAIPFVVPEMQMYLPMLGINLKEHFAKLREPRNFFSPSTQVLVLHVIYHRLESECTSKDFAGSLGYSVMTVNRALDELADAGLGEYGTRGKERKIQFGSPKETWEKLKSRLRSPVKNRFRVFTPTDLDLRIKGGLNALAHYSDLAEPEIPLFVQSPVARGAVSKLPPGQLIDIETWRYAPLDTGKANIGFADPLSVYLSMNGDYDERISMARDQLLDKMKW